MGILDLPGYSRKQSDDMLAAQVAFLECRHGSSVAFSPSAGINIPGLAFVVPPSTRPMYVRWNATFWITAQGGGLISLNMYEMIGINGTATLRGVSDPKYIPAAQPVSGIAGKLPGEMWLPPSAMPRLFGPNVQLTRDAGSSLAVSVVMYDNEYNRFSVEVLQR